MKVHQLTTLCLAGVLCFGVSSIKAEAANLGMDAGIASLLNEAQDGTPETNQEIAKILSPSEYRISVLHRREKSWVSSTTNLPGL